MEARDRKRLLNGAALMVVLAALGRGSIRYLAGTNGARLAVLTAETEFPGTGTES